MPVAENRMVNNSESLTSKPSWRRLQTGALGAAMLLIAALDVAAGKQVSPWALYLLPIIAAAGLFGRRTALALATMAVGLIALTAAVAGHPFASWAFFAASLANRAICLFACAWLASQFFRAQPDKGQQNGTGIGNY
jgi:hypothetical protein